MRDPAKRFTVLWACKEAASKVIGMGLLKDFKDLVVKGDSDGGFAVFEKGDIVTRGTYDFVRGFVIAICHKRLLLAEDHIALQHGPETIST
jgi:phosphopantetheinyl transferase